WGAPYGAYTRELLPVPWLHLLYPKSVLAEIRSSQGGWHTKDLGVTGLYKLRIGKFLKLVEQARLEVIHPQLLSVCRQSGGPKWRGLGELTTAKVRAVLARTSFSV